MNADIIEEPLHLYAKRAMKLYIDETVSDRAIPDFKDGLKPVQRRILWAMYRLGLFNNLSYKKSARVVGEVIGKYHAHSDTGIYQAMVNLAQPSKRYFLVEGQGNWGSYSNDGAAASRYTEAKLSKYAEEFLLHKDYLKVVPYVENFDGSEVEPLFLPSRVPVSLMLNIQGIAAAARTGLPSFTLDSLIDACIYYIKNDDLPYEECKLEFTSIYGGKVISTKEEIKDLIMNGSGSITFESEYNVFHDRIEIYGVPDNFNMEKVISELNELQEVKSVRDEGSEKIKIVIYLNCKSNDLKALEKILKKTQTKALYSINVLNRTLEEDKILTNYKETSVIKVLINWCKFRISLEKKYLNFLISELEKNISYQKLLLLASKNLQVIFSALQKKDTLEEIIEKLKINKEQANIILNLPVKRLSKLSEEETEKTLDNLKKEVELLNCKLINIKDTIIKDLLTIKGRFQSEGKR